MVSVFFCLWGTDGLRILKSIGKTTHDFLRKAHTKSNDFRGKAERGAMAAEELLLSDYNELVERKIDRKCLVRNEKLKKKA